MKNCASPGKQSGGSSGGKFQQFLIQCKKLAFISEREEKFNFFDGAPFIVFHFNFNSILMIYFQSATRKRAHTTLQCVHVGQLSNWIRGDSALSAAFFLIACGMKQEWSSRRIEQCKRLISVVISPALRILQMTSCDGNFCTNAWLVPVTARPQCHCDCT